MLNAYEASDQPQLDRSVYNGIIVTPDQLRQSTKSQSPGANSLYVKPIRAERHRRNMSNLTGDHQLIKDHGIENEYHDSIRSRLCSRVPHPMVGHQSPSMQRIHTFNRNIGTRRSLGASSLAWAMPTDTSCDEPVPASRHADDGSSNGTNTGQQELVINVINLPNLNELGFTLDSYSDSDSGRFRGLRLRNRYFKQTVHLEARENCPFLPGDLVVSVNQHRLSRMHESKAIRYVYDAFNDANKYNVEFGVLRDSSDVDLDAEHVTSPFCYEAKTLPTRLRNRDSGIGQLSFDNFFDSSHQSVPSPPEKHRPRRSTQPSAIVFPPPLDATDAVPSLGVSKASKSPLQSPLLNNTTSFRFDPLATTFSDDHTASLHNTDSLTTTHKSWRRRDSHSRASPLQKRPSNIAQHPTDLNVFNTRAIGQMFTISLVKMSGGGFGFTMTSRDTQVITDENSREPVYIKKILSTGAAIEDGRLLVGDRLLSVNQVEVRNLHQVLEQLRSVEPGETVDLVVSRQVLARMEEDSTSVSKDKSLSHRPYTAFTYEFTVPGDVGQAGPPSLGVTLKWSNHPPSSDLSDCASDSPPRLPKYAPDPGLYVDSLVPDGLVCTGNRNETLRSGDRLAGVNGLSFEGLSSKVITAHIKTTLNDLYLEPRSNLNSFSLTVHRYDCPRRQSVVDGKTTSLRRSSLPSFDLSMVDLRTRRTRKQNYTPIRHGHSSLDLSQHQPVDGGGRTPFDSFLLDCNSYFDREGVGRRSVSEKRHVHMDAKEISFFQKNILPHRFGTLEDTEKHYSTMPTARRLKVHRERFAAAAALTTVSVGPVKALHQPASANTQSDSHAPPGRSSAKRDPESGNFLRGRNQNASFRNAVYRSLTSEESITDTPGRSNIGAVTTRHKPDTPAAPRSHVPGNLADMHPRVHNRQPNSHNVDAPQGASSGTPPDLNRHSAPILPAKRQPKTLRSSRGQYDLPTTSSPHRQQYDPPQHITTSRSSRSGFETLKGLFRRVSGKVSLEARGPDIQQKLGNQQLSPQSIPEPPASVVPFLNDARPSSHNANGQPVPPKRLHTHNAGHQSKSVSEYNNLSRQLPLESKVSQMVNPLSSHSPAMRVLSTGPNHRPTERSSFSLLPSQPSQVPPPLPPRIGQLPTVPQSKQTSNSTRLGPHHSHRLPLKSSETPTRHRHLSSNVPPDCTKNVPHGNHSSAGKPQRQHHTSRSSSHSQHIPGLPSVPSPSRPQRSRIYENKEQTIVNGSPRSPNDRAIQREMVAHNGYHVNPSISRPSSHTVLSPHPSRSHQSRATERLPMPIKKHPLLPANNTPIRHLHEHPRRSSRYQNEVAS